MKRILIPLLSSMILLSARPARSLICSSLSGAPQLQGSQMDHYISDPVLHRRWAVVVACSHPERPWTLKEVPWQGAARPAVSPQTMAGLSSGNTPLIAAGTRVRLWSSAGGASIELAGTALEAGGVGQSIHVRTGTRGTVLEGRVRGAGSVELSSSGKWQNKSANGWIQ